MPQTFDKAFTFDHDIRDDDSITFRCSDDAGEWPWLALDPLDPIVMQTMHFWTSVETGVTKGTFDTSKWSALTELQWTCGEPGAGHAVRGIAENGSGDVLSQINLYDAHDALVYQMQGKGVIFQNRDFESWRAKAKAALGTKDKAADFPYAPAQSIGLAEQSHVYLTPLSDGDTPAAQGLVTSENGFPPVQPFMSGSGDHVNATHLGDIARQFVQLVLGGKAIVMSTGKIAFMRYVELDHVFDIAQTAHDPEACEISMLVTQAGKDCADITFRYRTIV